MGSGQTKIFTRSLFEHYLYYLEQHCGTLYEILLRVKSPEMLKYQSDKFEAENNVYESLFLLQFLLYHLEQLKLNEEMIMNVKCDVENEYTSCLKQRIVRILTDMKSASGHHLSGHLLKKIHFCIHYILCQEILSVERTTSMKTYNHTGTAWLNRGKLNPYAYRSL